MISELIITALFFGVRYSITYGFLPLSTVTVHLETPGVRIRAALRWSAVFVVSLLAIVLLTRVVGFFFFSKFDKIGHLLIFFLGFISLINLSEKREPFKRFIRDKRCFYLLGILQGLSAVEIVAVLYSLTSEITLLTLLISALLFGLCFSIVTSAMAIVLGLVAGTGPKIRKTFIIIIALLCVINGAINFFLYI